VLLVSQHRGPQTGLIFGGPKGDKQQTANEIDEALTQGVLHRVREAPLESDAVLLRGRLRLGVSLRTQRCTLIDLECEGGAVRKPFALPLLGGISGITQVRYHSGYIHKPIQSQSRSSKAGRKIAVSNN